MNEPQQTDITELNPEERINYILNVRRRVVNGEDVTDDEIRDSVRLIRLDRSTRAGSKKKGKEKAPPITLADF